MTHRLKAESDRSASVPPSILRDNNGDPQRRSVSTDASLYPFPTHAK